MTPEGGRFGDGIECTFKEFSGLLRLGGPLGVGLRNAYNERGIASRHEYVASAVLGRPVTV